MNSTRIQSEVWCRSARFGLVVYTPGSDPAESVRDWEMMLGPLPASKKDWITQHSNYMPMFRFTLMDEGERLFTVERWCFRGSIDGWISLHDRGTLSEMAKKYLPHLKGESFFDLV